jgi:hypothetical protein
MYLHSLLQRYPCLFCQFNLLQIEFSRLLAYFPKRGLCYLHAICELLLYVTLTLKCVNQPLLNFVYIMAL